MKHLTDLSLHDSFRGLGGSAGTSSGSGGGVSAEADDGMWGGEVGTAAATRGGSLATGEGAGSTMPALNYFNWSH